jgi:co-chaperonin GroES (HSP10)
MKLLGNRVQIEPIIEESVGLIVLSRMSRQMPDKGTILAISDEAAKISGCKVGQKVFFDKHHQTLEEDQKTTMVAGEDLLALL